MSKVIIRKAKEKELKIIQGLNHELFLHDGEYDPLLNMDWPFEKQGEDYFKDKISGEKGVCFVAEVGGEIVGYLAGRLMESYSYRKVEKMAELDNTLVKEEFRGQGIGENLFKEFIKWSKNQDAERIKVIAYADNFGAIKFYKRVGFIPYETVLEYKIK